MGTWHQNETADNPKLQPGLKTSDGKRLKVLESLLMCFVGKSTGNRHKDFKVFDCLVVKIQ